MASSSARKYRFGRRAASKKAYLNIESLEARNLLATATDDTYTTNEDTPLTTGFVTAVPFKSQWRYFEGMDRVDDTTVAADTTQYPVDAQGDQWFDPNHDYATPNFSTWKTGNAPFATSNANEEPVGAFNRGVNGQVDGYTPTGGVLGPRGTIIDGHYKGPNTKVTFLMRHEFVLDDPNPPLQGRLSVLIDDGARFYIDGVPVCLNPPADQSGCTTPADNLDSPITSTSEAAGAPSETTIRNYTIEFANIDGVGGVLALEPGTHTLAIEVHNDAPGSTDLGAEVQLALSSGSGAVGVADNDSPVQPITAVTVVDQPFDVANPAVSAGTVTMGNDGNFTFAPAANFAGTARFTYTITDAVGTSGPANVTITVNPINDAPTAVNDSYFAAEGQTITVTSPSAASFTVVPMNATGWDVNDELENSFATEYPVDSLARPWNAVDFDVTTSTLDGVPSPWDVGLTGGFQDGTVNALTTPTTVGVPAATETTFLARKSFTLTAAEATAGVGRFTYTCDSGCIMYVNGVRAGSSPNMATITNPLPTTFAGDAGDEDAPHATFSFPFGGSGPNLVAGTNVIAIETHNDSTASTDVGFDLMLELVPLAGVLNNDTDVDNATITAVIDDSSQVDAAGTFTLNPNGTFTFDPDPGVSGNLTFTYHATDGTASSNVATVTISISPDPNRPDAVDDAYTVAQGGTLVTQAATTTYLAPASGGWSYLDKIENGKQADPDIAAEGYPADDEGDQWFESDHDTADAAANLVGTWQTGAGVFAGPIDGLGVTATTLLEGIDDAMPPLDPIGDTENSVVTYLFRRTLNIAAGATLLTNLRVGILSDDGGVLYVNGQEVLRHLMDAGPVTTTTFANAGGDEDTYIPFDINVAGLLVNGDNTIAYELHQQNDTSSDAGFDMTITSAAGVLANDTDPQGDPLTAVLDTGPANAASFTLNPNGSFTYQPNAAFSGTDTFTYHANDGTLNSAPATVTITVTPSSTCTNDADLNDDTVVGRGDLAILVQNYGLTTGATPAQGDINCDGAIGLADLHELQIRLTPAPSPGAASAVVATAPHTVDRAVTGLDRAIERVRPRAPLAASRLEQVRERVQENTTGPARPSQESADTARASGIRASRVARAARAHSQAIQDLFG